MQIILDSQTKSILRMDRGDESLSVLKNFANEKDKSLNFSMIGACLYVELGYYGLKTKKYFNKEFNSENMGNIEIISVNGNVSWSEGEPIVHAHGVFSNEKYECFGGHINKLIISLTGETVVEWLPQKINKKFDEQTGLKLLSK